MAEEKVFNILKKSVKHYTKEDKNEYILSKVVKTIQVEYSVL